MLRLFPILAIAACVDAVDLGTQEQAIIPDQCPPWRCGSNSPLVNGVIFHDLHLFGLPNLQDFSLVRFQKGQTNYTPHVVHGRLSATSNAGTLAGSGLVDGYLVVRDATGHQFGIVVKAVVPATYWALHGAGLPPLEAYELRWVELDRAGYPVPGAPVRNLCSNPPAPLPIGTPNPDALGQPGFTALLFEGDRIDAAWKTVGAPDARWFNIGCAGHALAKLQLTGHTEVARMDGLPTTIDERTAMLKMLVADYCGNGSVYTVAGQKLQWRDDDAWMTVEVPSTLEARWTPAGATCLNTPRVNANPTPLGNQIFQGGVWADVSARCGLQACTNSSVIDTAGVHLLSANPN